MNENGEAGPKVQTETGLGTRGDCMDHRLLSMPGRKRETTA